MDRDNKYIENTIILDSEKRYDGNNIRDGGGGTVLLDKGKEGLPEMIFEIFIMRSQLRKHC